MITTTLAAAVVLSLITSACGYNPVVVSSHSPTPTFSRSAASAASRSSPPAQPTSTPAPCLAAMQTSPSSFCSLPPVSAVGSSCRLPLASSDAPLDGNASHGTKGKGGFLAFPNATFQTVPDSLGSYDAAAAKWLPVPSAWIAPDGSAYAYTDGARAYVVNAATGTSKAFPLPHPAMVVAYDTGGVYLEEVIPNSDADPHGLGLLDPDTGAYSQLFPAGSYNRQLWYSIEHRGFAYVVENYTNWGASPTDGPKPIGNELFRVDLNRSSPNYAGLVSVMAVPNTAILVVGFDGGDQPVVSARSTATASYRIYTAASIKIGGTPSAPGGPPQYEGPSNADWNPAGPVRGDAHGIWFTSKSGSIWLYVPGKGMQRVAQAPMQSPIIAGPCV